MAISFTMLCVSPRFLHLLAKKEGMVPRAPTIRPITSMWDSYIYLYRTGLLVHRSVSFHCTPHAVDLHVSQI